MKVKELKEILAALDDDAEVVVSDNFGQSGKIQGYITGVLTADGDRVESCMPEHVECMLKQMRKDYAEAQANLQKLQDGYEKQIAILENRLKNPVVNAIELSRALRRIV